MTTTFAILNIDETVDTIANWLPFVLANWQFIETRRVKDGLESEYRGLSGDPLYPATRRIGVYVGKPTEAGIPTFNVSVRTTTYVSADDGVDVIYAPSSVVLAWNMPWLAVPDEADLMALLMNNLSFALPDVTSGSVTTGFLTKIQRMISELDISTVVRT
jgi:hypothetical protein